VQESIAPRSRRREVRRSLDMAGAAVLFVMITHSGARAQTNRVIWITYVEAQRNIVYEVRLNLQRMPELVNSLPGFCSTNCSLFIVQAQPLRKRRTHASS